ncbi:putative spo11/DNA topoisomerase VI subunit A, spo11/DNA topoisomerase VI, subunit A [Helianthus annuus]|nr:putative spo11/DNA topoisomerase VI subunit A, spo11/DNA topoisomerase VI, subunit A [Helianthus annuus]
MKQINRKKSNSRVNHGLLTEDSWIFLSRSFCTRSLMRENTTKSFMRGIFEVSISHIDQRKHSKSLLTSYYLCLCELVWKMMEMCYEILVKEKRVTQRELFYKLLCVSPDYFPSQVQVNQTIQGQTLLLLLSMSHDIRAGNL